MARKSNVERIGAEPDNSAPASSGSELSFVVPTEFVDLPSGGLYYPPDHPLHQQDTLEIKYMTAKEEDILNSEVLLKKGIAIDRMLQSIVLNKDIKIDDLLLGDKNALIVTARISGYGAEYPVEMACPNCRTRSQQDVDLESARVLSGAVKDNIHNLEDVDTSSRGHPVLTLPKSGHKVEIRFLTSKDEKDIEKAEENAKKHKLPPSQLTSILKKMIISVNDIEDRATISQFVDTLPAMDSKYLRGVYKIINPTMTLEHDFSCMNCGHDGTVEVPITTTFFWPDR